MIFIMMSAALVGLVGIVPVACAENLAHEAKIAEGLSKIEKYLEKGNYPAAQDARVDVAKVSEQSGRFDVAARQYELILATRPRKSERVKFFTKLGHARMQLKEYGQAIGAYEDALHDMPKDWDANLGRARAFSAADINLRAIESYKRCIQLRPREVAPYEEIAGVYQKQGFLGKALNYYEQALARDPKPEIYLQIADCHVHQQNFRGAIETLARAKSRLPRAEYDVRLGEIYQKLGDARQALNAWEEALLADPKRDDVRLRLSMMYHRQGRKSDSDRIFKELLAHYPESALVHHLKAMQLFQRGERDAARLSAIRAQQLAPTEIVAHFNELLLLEIKENL